MTWVHLTSDYIFTFDLYSHHKFAPQFAPVEVGPTSASLLLLLITLSQEFICITEVKQSYC